MDATGSRQPILDFPGQRGANTRMHQSFALRRPVP